MDNPLERLCRPVLSNSAFLKRYGNDLYRLVQVNSVHTDGAYTPKGSVNDEKLSCNIVRARSTIRELGLCNSWQHFVTLTLDKSKRDRYDLKTSYKALSHWIRNFNRLHGCSIKYLLIPEQHKDGAWHFHGLMMGIPPDFLTPFTLKDKLPKYIRNRLLKGEVVYNWIAYAVKFGWCVIDPIRDHNKVVSYITKYITKDLERSISDIGAHLYYASQKLERAKLIKKGSMAATIEPDWENEYCKMNWFDGQLYSEEELKALFL